MPGTAARLQRQRTAAALLPRIARRLLPPGQAISILRRLVFPAAPGQGTRRVLAAAAGALLPRRPTLRLPRRGLRRARWARPAATALHLRRPATARSR